MAHTNVNVGSTAYVWNNIQHVATNQAFALKIESCSINAIVDRMYLAKQDTYGTGQLYIKGVLWDSSGNVIGVGDEALLTVSMTWGSSTFSTKPALRKGNSYYIGVVIDERAPGAVTISYETGPQDYIGHLSGNNYSNPTTFNDNPQVQKEYSIYAACFQTPNVSKWNGVSFDEIEQINDVDISTLEKIYQYYLHIV